MSAAPESSAAGTGTARSPAQRIFRTVAACGWSAGIFLLQGCDGKQSALAPAGREAKELSDLFWWMLAGALVIWAAVMALGIYSVRVSPDVGKRRETFFIVVCGAIIPTVVLAGLLAYGLWILPRHVAPAPEGSLKIVVDGEQWWWRVRYETRNGSGFDLANEIRLPVGEPVQFELRSSNVIHAFWIPPIGGKKDMIPGRVNQLALTPTKTGVFRGVCAEYCGASHALMAFDVVVTGAEEFSEWAEQQASPAVEPATPLSRRGREQFFANGCSACHAIRGTTANSRIGPDLTHVGSRLSIGAGTFPRNQENLVRWIAHVHEAKPGVHMPHFSMLSQEDLEALAAYLEALK